MSEFTDIEKAELITQIVCSFCNAPSDVFTRKTRKSEYVKVKHYACYLIKENTKLSARQIAELFKLKNHSSIFLLIQKIKDLMTFDRKMRSDIQTLTNIIDFKGLSQSEKVNTSEFYYINMDTFVSYKETSERAIIFVGYSDKEIVDLIGLKKLRKHENTKKFILENNEKTEGES